MSRILKYSGAILAAGIAAVLIWRAAGDMPPLDLTSGRVWAMAGIALALYVLSQLVSAVAWRATLSIWGVALARTRAESQLLASQIAKYVPGNIAHLIGRAVLARADGVGGAVLAGAMMLEVGFVLGSAVLAAAAVFVALPDLTYQLTARLPQAHLDGAVVATGAGAAGLVAVAQVVIWHRAGRPPLTATGILKPLLLHLANFVILGASLWCVARVVGDGVSLTHALAVFAVAWAAGFVMPGAPGGLGVRDGIVALGLEAVLTPGAALAAALIHRSLSVAGDVIVFALGLLLRRTVNSRAETASVPTLDFFR